MRIKAIESIVKSEKRAIIWHGGSTVGGEQFVSLSGAMYVLEGLPRLNAPQFRRMLDVDEEKLSVDERDTLPDQFNVSDSEDGEKEARELDIGLVIGGREMRCFLAGGEVLLFPEKYFAPFAGLDSLQYTVRKTTHGVPYLAVKDGFFFIAAVLPYRLNEKQLVQISDMLSSLSA